VAALCITAFGRLIWKSKSFGGVPAGTHGGDGTPVEHEAIYRVIARQPDQARNEMANRLDCVLRELHSFVIRASGSP
jgi:hypothetical protein